MWNASMAVDSKKENPLAPVDKYIYCFAYLNSERTRRQTTTALYITFTVYKLFIEYKYEGGTQLSRGEKCLGITRVQKCRERETNKRKMQSSNIIVTLRDRIYRMNISS